MSDFNPEVPAQVRHMDHVQNGVRVVGGTNWDLARSAVATPIAPMPDPQPLRPAGVSEEVLAVTPYQVKHKMPGSAPHTTVRFALNSALVPVDGQKALRAVPKGVAVVVAGHADPSEKSSESVARKRADAVAAYLKKQGKRVETVRAFGDELPLTASPFKAQVNRRVEVYVP